MKILDVLTSPWSICPAKLAEIRNIYHAHLRGPKIDWKAMAEMKHTVTLGGSDRQDEQYQMMNGVAVIPVKGVLTKGMSFFSFLFGGSSMKQIGVALQAALDDPLVKSILLDVDSPGGTVDGTEELADAVHQARGKKPIIAYTDGMMTSGAYWIASAAEKIFISGNTVQVGSVGVVATHVDQSKADEAYGENWTEITAGRYKRMASGHKPLTEEGAAYIQDQVDYLYSNFVNTVARNRGVSEKEALAMADGKIFIGKQAIEIGLVDGVEAFSDLINNMAAGSAANYLVKEEFIVNLEELKMKHPDVYALAVAECQITATTESAAAGRAAGIEEGKALGAAAERQRITDVRAQLIPGHEALIDELAADGKTTGPEAAVKVLAAEKGQRAAALAALKADGNLGVAAASVDVNLAASQDAGAKTKAEAGEKLDKIAKEIKADKKCSYAAALNEALTANPALAKIYEGKEE